MKRKLAVAVALVGGPSVVLLDEPSSGLDPGAQRNLWDLIKVTMKGRAVVLTTHSMGEADLLCDRVGIMVKGTMRCIGTPQELKERYAAGRIRAAWRRGTTRTCGPRGVRARGLFVAGRRRRRRGRGHRDARARGRRPAADAGARVPRVRRRRVRAARRDRLFARARDDGEGVFEDCRRRGGSGAVAARPGDRRDAPGRGRRRGAEGTRRGGLLRGEVLGCTVRLGVGCRYQFGCYLVLGVSPLLRERCQAFAQRPKLLNGWDNRESWDMELSSGACSSTGALGPAGRVWTYVRHLVRVRPVRALVPADAGPRRRRFRRAGLACFLVAPPSS